MRFLHELKWFFRIGWHKQKDSGIARMTWNVWWHPMTNETRRVWKHINRIDVEPGETQ